jgi:hypothetical protein
VDPSTGKLIAGPLARATGGPVMAGRSYLVGDGTGPEIFTPSQNGSITSNNDTRNVLNGSGSGGSSGGQFTGSLYLDSGQFLGTVQGMIDDNTRATVQRVKAIGK